MFPKPSYGKPGLGQGPRPPTSRPYIPPPTYHVGQKVVDEASIEKLFTIVQDGDINKIKSFVSENNISFDQTNMNGQTVLHVIIESENEQIKERQKYELVKYFIDHGVQVDAFDKNNVTALHLSAKHQLYDITNLLLTRGANPKALDSQNMNPLHYAAQGNIVKCKKPIKKVGKLIPNDNITYAKVSEGELKDLSTNIVDVLYTSEFNKFLQHIKASIGISHEIYPEEFRKMNDDYRESINNIILDRSLTPKQRNDKIEITTKEFISKIRALLENKLSKSSKPIDVKLDHTQGWSPNDKNNILPEDGDVEEKVLSMMSNHMDEERQLFEKIMNTFITIGPIMSDIRENRDLIFDEISNIIYHNRNMEVNNFGMDLAEIMIPWEKLSELISDTQQLDKLEYKEINIFGIVNDLLLEPPMLKSEPPSVVRLVKSDRQVRKRDIVSSPLTDDEGEKISDANVTRQIRGKDPIKATSEELPNKIINQAINIPIYFPSILSFTIDQISKHIELIRQNLDLTMIQQNKNYSYFVLNRIFSHLILSILNVFQNIVLALEQQPQIKNKTTLLSDKFKSLFNKTTHKYRFSLEYAADAALNIDKYVESIYNNFDKVYTKLNELYKLLNDDIDLLNKYSSVTYIHQYFLKSNKLKTFDDKNVGNLSYLLNRQYSNLEQLPDSLTNYKAITGSYGTLNNIRKAMYEKYIPNINIYNYPLFYSPSDEEGVTMKYARSYLIDQDPIVTVPTPNNTNPTIGYLVDKFYHQYGVDEDAEGPVPEIPIPRLPYGPSNQGTVNLNNAIIDTDNQNYNIGNVGNKYVSGLTRNRIEPVLPSIHDSLDQHIYLIKNNILQNMMYVFDNPNTTRYPQSTNVLINNPDLIRSINEANKKLEQYVANASADPAVKYVIIGSITDELLNIFINYAIQTGSNNYVRKYIGEMPYMPGDSDSSQILSRILSQNVENLFVIDTGFELHLNELFKDILDDFFVQVPGNSDINYNTLKYTIPIVERVDDLNNGPDDIHQIPIYTQNYANMGEITEEMCYNTDPRIIYLLASNRSDINQKDAVYSSPIFYAIEALHPQAVKAFVENGATVAKSSIKNKSNMTPVQFAFNLYNNHNQIIYSSDICQIMNTLYYPLYKSIKDNILSKPDEYKNNVIKYLDTMFPMLLIMYNNMFYHYMTRYIGKWSFEKNQMLLNTLSKYGITSSSDIVGIPLLENIDTKKIVEHNSNLDVLNEGLYEYGKTNSKNALLISRYEEHIKNLDKEITALKPKVNLGVKQGPTTSDPTRRNSAFIDNYIRELNDRKASVEEDIQKLNEENDISTGQVTNMEANLNERSNVVKIRFNNRIDPFVQSKQHLNAQGPAELYQNVFDYVVNENNFGNNNIEYTGHEDLRLYNELWKAYLCDQKRLQNITNIHLTSVILQSKIIDQITNSSMLDIICKTRDIKDDVYIVNELYKDVFVPIVKYQREMPQMYNTNDNFVLKQVIDIIIHVVRYTISNSLYHTVVKTLTKYLLTINPKELSDKNVLTVYNNKENYDKYVQAVVSKIVSSDPKLIDYIIKEMPTMLVKNILQIYESDIDEHKQITSVTSLFDHIKHIITSNTIIPIANDSKLIQNLEKYVFPYYEELFTQSIPLLKTTIDNYGRYILNEDRYIDITNNLVAKAATEITNECR